MINKLTQRRVIALFVIITLLGMATGCMQLLTPPNTLPPCPLMLGSWTSHEYDVLEVRPDGTQTMGMDYVSVFDVNQQQNCEFSGYHTWENPSERQGNNFIGMVDPDTHEFTIIEPGTSSRYMGTVDGDHMDLVFTHFANNLTYSLVYGTSLARRDAEPDDHDEEHTCPDISGRWNSSSYSVLDVTTDGGRSMSAGWTTTLEIIWQEGCIFRAIDSWTDGTNSGSAAVAGVIHGDASTISMVEVPQNLEEDTIARISARLVGPNRLDLTFIGDYNDGSGALAFTTSYSKTGTPPEPASCPDVTGAWSGGPFEAFRMNSSGSFSSVQRSSRELVISEQSGCLINGQNRWSAEDGVMNSEYFVGHMDANAGIITIMELDPHPNDGTTAIITNRLLDDNTLLSEYTGYASDGTFAQVFAEVLERE